MQGGCATTQHDGMRMRMRMERPVCQLLHGRRKAREDMHNAVGVGRRSKSTKERIVDQSVGSSGRECE